MVNPTANWCHPTNDLKMFTETTNDLTIESAVKGTSGTAYSNFDDLRNNATTALLDSTYGSGAITSTNEFRGYPKPTVTATFEEFAGISSTANALRVTLSVPVKVGFDISVFFTNTDTSTTYETTLSAGSTSELNPLFQTTGADLDYTMTWSSTNSTVQYTPTLAGDTTGTLVYTEPVIRDYSTVANAVYDTDDCAASTSAIPANWISGRVWHDATPISVGQTLYEGDKASNGGTTNVGLVYIRRANLFLGWDKIVTNSSGVVQSIVQCSP